MRVERSLVGMLTRRKADEDVCCRGGGCDGCVRFHTDTSGQDDELVDRAGSGPKAILWITHSDAQAERVGTRVVNLGRSSGP